MGLTVRLPRNEINKLLYKLDVNSRDIAIRRSLGESSQYIVGWIKDKRLSGPRPTYLGVQTGRLRSSISATAVKKTGKNYYVEIGTNVVYGRIHEYGGQAGRSGSANIPARPFLKPAIEDRQNINGVLMDLKRHINRMLEG